MASPPAIVVRYPNVVYIIGLSPPPIETPQGWLVIYHGVRQTAAGSLYRLGLALPWPPALSAPCWRGWNSAAKG